MSPAASNESDSPAPASPAPVKPAGAPAAAVPARSQAKPAAGKCAIRIAAVVPVYNQPDRLSDVVQHLRRLNLPVILVDDGSSQPTRAACDALAGTAVKVVHRPRNGGKGAAVATGFKAAARLGFTHALQIDADVQHDPKALPKFLQLAQKFPQSLICGYPVYDHTAPASRRIGRKMTNFWCAVNSLSLSFADAMCGLRVYPLAPTLSVLDNAKIGQRMEFDPEILVRLLWSGVRVKNAPVPVSYPEGGVSHFHAFSDNLRISLMHAKLCVMMLTRLPIILFSRLCGWAPEARKDAATKAVVGAPAPAPKSALEKKALASTGPRTPEQLREAQRAERAAIAAAAAAQQAQTVLDGLEKHKRGLSGSNSLPDDGSASSPVEKA